MEMMIENAEIFKIDLIVKTDAGKTGFQLATMRGNHDVINLMKRKMPSIAVIN